MQRISQRLVHGRRMAYLLVEIITAKLHGGIWNDADAVRPIPTHESSPAFFPPHFHETLPYRQLVLISAGTLHLE